MSTDGYWGHLLDSRITRRRGLAAAGAGTAAAALLAACGSSKSDSKPADSGPKDASGLLSQRIDTTASAVKGGTLQSLTNADVTSLDPLTSQSFTTQLVAGFIYSRILKVVPGVKAPSRRDVEGDVAESWEVSPDKLTITLKLRKNLKWDAREPTASRALSADDVVWSWNKFAAASPYRADLANKANPDAAIDSMTAPDANTVVVKLAAPDASAVTMLSSSAHLYILPKEAQGGFDPRKDARGSSAWTIEKYQPSIGFTYAKNPNWYRSDRPFADKLDMPIISEYAQQLAQFRSGNVHFFAIAAGQAGVQQQDVLQTKRDLPELSMLASEYAIGWFNSWFGYAGASPFKDERVRQAVSMAYDRDSWIDAIFNTSDFKKAGLPVDTRWHSHMTSGLDGWWLNPQDDKAFGANNKYFKFNVAEAKKLLTAAGFANGVEVPAHYVSTPQYGTTFPNQAQIQIGFMNDAGIKTKVDNPDYQTVWLNNYYYGKGNFEGVAIGADSTEADPGTFFFARFHPRGPRFKGFDPSGTDPKAGDPELTKMIDDIRKEFDTEKRRQIAARFQQSAAKSMYMVPFPGQAAPFALRWPCIGNGGVYFLGSQYAPGAETLVHLWLDKTKAPLAKKA